MIAEQQSLRSYPRPFGINLAHVLGYLSPITGDELDESEQDGDRSVNGASVVGRAGVEKEYDAWLRGMPGYTSVEVDSMGRVIGDESRGARPRPATPWSPRSTPRCRASSSSSWPARSRTARGTFDPVTDKNYVADSGAAIVMEAKTGRIVAMASQPTYDPEVWVGGVSRSSSTRSTREGRHARCSAGPPRASSRRARPGSRS